QMLTGVLLHVIEAARPVDGAFHGNAVDGRCQLMSDPGLLVGYLDYAYSRNGSEIERLSAGCRIEGCTIEIDRAAIVGDRRNLGGEGFQVRIGIVKPFSHRKLNCKLAASCYERTSALHCVVPAGSSP